MKRFTRIVSVILACAMAMCLLTACGGGGGGTSQAAKDQAYVTNLGASSTIKSNDSLTTLAKKTVAALKSGDTSELEAITEDVGNSLKEADYTDGSMAIEMKMDVTYQGKSYSEDKVRYYDSTGKEVQLGTSSGADVKTGVLKEYISEMTAFGTASETIEMNQEGVTGSVTYTVTYFAK